MRGYRFDVCLPDRRQPAPPVVQLVTQADAGQVHRELRAQHFVIVARPLEPGASGYRAFYLDESGHVWIHDGVSDEETSKRNPLPPLHLTSAEGKDPSGRSWVRLDKLVPRGAHEWKKR